MKIHGRKLEPHVAKLYLPRGDDIIEITAKSITDDSQFFKICPEPKPPFIMKKGGKKEPDFKDKTYLREIDDYANRKFAWMILSSITITGAEWETVNVNDPNTWLGWRKELTESGFNNYEINRIVNLMHEANCLDESKLEEARNRFLAIQLEKEQLSSQKEELLSIVSGGHVNGSGSDPQESLQETSSS